MRRRSVSAAAGDTEKSVSVVVVDPGPLSLLTLAGVLDTQGWHCVCARTAAMAIDCLKLGRQDLFVWDVASDAAEVLETLEKIRQTPGYENVPAVLLAESRWAGLEKKVEALPATRCLFKPIDPPSLIAVAEPLLWMPGLVDAHRRRGSRPGRPGWVSL